MAIERPPAHLSEDSAAWWRRVVTDYALDEHHRHLLTLACECLDRGRAAREAIQRDGLMQGTRVHPATKVENESAIRFARLLRELDLDVEPPAEAKRPPMLRSVRGHAS